MLRSLDTDYNCGAASPAPRGEDDAARLAFLESLHIIDTAPEDAFDRLTALAADTLTAPVALISFVLDDRQWFKSAHGLDLRETPLAQSFCAHTIADTEVMVIEDAAADPRFAKNPLVLGAPNIRFYAGAPIIVEGGHRLGALCVIDSQPRKFSEKGKTRLAALAACVVSELELRRAAAREVEARRVAEEALDARRRLVTKISHEMRTPLNGVLGFERLLRETPLDQHQKDYLSVIATSGKVLLGFVNELIDSADMDASPLAPRPFDLASLINETLETVAGAAAQQGMTIVSETPTERVEVVADPDRLRQALSTLLMQAIGRDGSGAVRLNAYVLENDEGVGFQVIGNPGPNAETEGDGKEAQADHCPAGLAGLVQRLGGRMSFARKENVGAVVQIEFACPVRRIDNSEEEASQALHVLAVDDMEANRLLLDVLVTQMGHKAMLAEDGEQAVDLAAAHAFDIILMDLQMPRVDGYAAARRIAANARGRAPAVIAVSGNAAPEDRQACFAAGFADFLSKPVTPESLSLAISRAMRQRDRRNAA